MKSSFAFTLWGTLRIVAIAIPIFVFSTIAGELFALRQVVYFHKTSLDLVWEEPEGDPHHYRIEITDTDQLAEPAVVTEIYYGYSKGNSFTIDANNYHSYSFRVQAVSETGYHSEYSDRSKLFVCDLTGELEARQVEAKLPKEFNLSQNYPNPFNSSTLIEYTIPLNPGSSVVRTSITIFNALGQDVRTLVDDEKSPGRYSVRWDGRDDYGSRVGSGAYFYRLNAGERSLTKKMLYVK